MVCIKLRLLEKQGCGRDSSWLIDANGLIMNTLANQRTSNETMRKKQKCRL
jgi:hypothetical protein